MPRTSQLHVLIVGADGSLGTELYDVISSETRWQVSTAARREATIRGSDREFDSTDRTAWGEIFANAETRPDVVVNAAAMTNVDRCEVEREKAWSDNVELVTTLADYCRRHRLHMVQVSTDNVFNGKEGPYDEVARPEPINYYGKTKLAAENECRRQDLRCAIIRTMWLYGGEASRPSFVSWVLDALSKGTTVRVAADEYGSPTLYHDLAYGILRVIEQEFTGTINIAGPQVMSRWDVALLVASYFGLQPGPLEPVASAELGRAAQRPLRSGLITLKAQTLLGLRPQTLLQGLESSVTRRTREHMARYSA